MKGTHSFLGRPSVSRETFRRGLPFKFPGPNDRVTINGMTGSGKSVFAMWLFSESADFENKPWIILDFKQSPDDLIEPALQRKLFALLDVRARLPEKPGVYVVRHNMRDGIEHVVDLLWRIYERGHVGMFLDEATMIPELRGQGNTGGPFQSLLSQGRSKGIPVWVLAQRPAHVNLMVLTENNFYSAFKLRSKDDLKKVRDNIPEDSARFTEVWGDNATYPPHWSRWFDVQQNANWRLRPCPPPKTVLSMLRSRLAEARDRATV